MVERNSLEIHYVLITILVIIGLITGITLISTNKPLIKAESGNKETEQVKEVKKENKLDTKSKVYYAD